MTGGFRKFLIGLGAAVLALLAVVKLSVWLVEYQPRCGQPCRDPGETPASPQARHYSNTLAPICNMVGLTVEVKSNLPLKVSEPVQLFFRIAITNKSCLNIRLDPDQWIALYKPPWRLEVLDVDGSPAAESRWPIHNEVERLWVVEGEDRLQLFNQRNGLHADENFIELPPGSRVSPLGVRLSPAKRVRASWRDAEGTYDGFGWKHVPLPKGISAPPEGFQLWGYWIFKRPGKVRVRAILDLPQLYAIFPRPYAHLVPEVWLHLLEEYGILTTSPDRSYNVYAESEAVELEVKP